MKLVCSEENRTSCDSSVNEAENKESQPQNKRDRLSSLGVKASDPASGNGAEKVRPARPEHERKPDRRINRVTLNKFYWEMKII